MLFLACRQQRPAVGVVERHVRSFRNIDLFDLLEPLDLIGTRFSSYRIWRTVKVGRSNSLSGIRHWMDSDVEQAVSERIVHMKLAWECEQGQGRNWLAFAEGCRIAKSLLDARPPFCFCVN
jgi:hypothetical protein